MNKKIFFLFIATAVILSGCGKIDDSTELETEQSITTTTTEQVTTTEEVEETTIYTFGFYDNNVIEIEWITDSEADSFDISVSDDGEKYTVINTVADNKYSYTITEKFEKRYFKVSFTEKNGTLIESAPFVATKSENGYSVDFLDSDDDGLADIFEIKFGTDINESDSDHDGLTDYQEVYITGTDPIVYDSVISGISDANADSDDDGLSNIYEIQIGANPQLADSDDDGLSDYDEINTYNTDPLNPDSDDDDLKDGDEPHIGLNPTNPETFGVPDAEYKVVQTVQANSSVFSYINTEENPYSLSISLNAAGYAENALSAEISGYTNVLSDNTAIVGNIVSIDYFYDEFEDVTLNFEMSSEYLDNMGETTVEGLGLEGIDRLWGFYYDEVNNILCPVETEIVGNTVVVEAAELGDYCLIDLNTWLEMLNLDFYEEEDNA